MSFVQRLFSRVTGSPNGRLSESRSVSFGDLSENPDPRLLPPLDRPGLKTANLTPEQQEWVRDGVVILPRFMPDSVTAPYIEVRRAFAQPGGWPHPVPYLHVPELRNLALYPPLMQMMQHLIGEKMMLHLALTGWISTERNWHQDDYLNPPHVNAWYAAVWVALDHIHPDSGPFEYIPGSHRWPLLRQEKVRNFLTQEEMRRPNASAEWPKYTERFVTPAVEAEIGRRDVASRTFLAEKGDVLIWHGRLMHRGSAPIRPGMERRSLIAHYSGIEHRPDMPNRTADDNDQAYAVFDIPVH